MATSTGGCGVVGSSGRLRRLQARPHPLLAKNFHYEPTSADANRFRYIAGNKVSYYGGPDYKAFLTAYLFRAI